MKAKIAAKLMEKYVTCPMCGSDKLGPDQGSVAIHDESFKRSCSCGWSVEVKEEDVINE